MTTDEQLPVVVPELPDRIQRYGVELRRWNVADAPQLHAAIEANVDHLRPYMAWIALEPQTLQQRRALIQTWTTEWADGGDVLLGIWRNNLVVGSAGLHRRLGPDGLELGYWVDRGHLRKGVATAVSRALTDLAFTIPGINQVQISHDVSNLASARVPAKLGYQQLPNRPAKAAPAPASTGIEGVWLMTRDQWHGRTVAVDQMP